MKPLAIIALVYMLALPLAFYEITHIRPPRLSLGGVVLVALLAPAIVPTGLFISLFDGSCVLNCETK